MMKCRDNESKREFDSSSGTGRYEHGRQKTRRKRTEENFCLRNKFVEVRTKKLKWNLSLQVAVRLPCESRHGDDAALIVFEDDVCDIDTTFTLNIQSRVFSPLRRLQSYVTTNELERTWNRPQRNSESEMKETCRILIAIIPPSKTNEKRS